MTTQLKTSHLHTNRDLIDVKFDGYKLGDSTQVLAHTLELTCQPLRIPCDSSHFSFQYLRAYDLHNHLYSDPWRADTVHFVDNDFYVNRASHQPHFDLGVERVCLLPMSDTMDDAANDPRSPSVFCVTREWALAADGRGGLHVLKTADHPEPWVVTSSFHNVLEGGRTFVVVGGGEAGGRMVACLWNITDSRESKPVSTVAFVHLTQGDEGWIISGKQEMSGPSSPAFVAVDVAGNQAVVLSEKDYKAQVLEEKVETSNGTTNGITGDQSSHPGLGRNVNFVWVQTDDSIAISCRLPKDVPTASIHWTINPSSLVLSLPDDSNLLPTSRFYGPIIREDCVWTRDGDVIDVHIEKAPGTGRWVQAFEGDHTPETIDPSEVRKALESLEKYTSGEIEGGKMMEGQAPSFANETEECDFSDAEPLTLYHYLLGATTTTECTLIAQTNLGTRELLFTGIKDQTSSGVLVLKYNVDALVYTPSVTTPASPTDPSLHVEHTCTFNALAYVLASKQDKKFLGCSGTYQYAVMCDATRNVFVYYQPLEGKHTATQKLLPVSGNDSIIGFQATSSCVFVLTDSHLHVARVMD
eukprot:comp19680_c0_seq2/m.23350 comp19680_c0_seq2/g.23350  ORF comp19680_c0_seq2/g.23350 comp19680_c0_seq2/m.23350 type:complete len:583 (-) comp19680_c0_seq2:99-1847(-)